MSVFYGEHLLFIDVAILRDLLEQLMLFCWVKVVILFATVHPYVIDNVAKVRKTLPNDLWKCVLEFYLFKFMEIYASVAITFRQSN